jgi:hypothetical protein
MAHWSIPPPPHSNAVRVEEGGDESGIRWSMAVARVSERDGASTATSRWCRLDWRRAGVACCRRRPCRGWTGCQLILLAAGSSCCSWWRRWWEPLDGRTARCCGDGLRMVTQAWRSGTTRDWPGPRRRLEVARWHDAGLRFSGSKASAWQRYG